MFAISGAELHWWGLHKLTLPHLCRVTVLLVQHTNSDFLLARMWGVGHVKVGV